MQKTILLLASLLCVNPGFGQAGQGKVPLNLVPEPTWHYQEEYTLDASANPAAWESGQEGLHAAFGSTDELYLRCEVPDQDRMAGEWQDSGWRGERLNAQLLVWSADSLEQVRLSVGDLVNDHGAVIPARQVTLRMVRYVLSNFPYEAGDFWCDVNNDSVYLLPDRLESFERFDLPGNTVRPVWITLDLGASQEPGVYAGTLEVAHKTGSSTLALNITVREPLLPGPGEWDFRLDLWQNPWVIADYFKVRPWSREHKMLLKQHLALYAGAGGKYITTYAVHSPWSDNSYRIEGSMIEWVRAADGSWKFDFSIFDQYVELAMEAGIDGAITIYTPVPWGYRFRYLDEASGNYIEEEWSPLSSEFREIWMVFLDDLKAHLTGKGWFGKSYLGINENPLEITVAAARVIREHSPDWKITYAGEWHDELSGLLDDYSIIIGQTPNRAKIRERTSRGQTTTFYVCCNPPKPNNFVFSPPVEGRYLGWYAASHGYDGFLRWAYDAWPADPMRDARHTLWPAGDCFLVYPGGNSSIRFEKLREGIADFEKITLLRKMTLQSADDQVIQLMKDFEAHLTTLGGPADFSKNDFSPTRMSKALLEGEAWMERIIQALDR